VGPSVAPEVVLAARRQPGLVRGPATGPFAMPVRIDFSRER
jgi:hypothetical protein